MSSQRRPSPPSGVSVWPGRMSLVVKLPLLISIVLASVLVTSLIATMTTLRRTALLAGSERVKRAVHEIVSVGVQNMPLTVARYRAVGNDSAVQRALLARRAGPGARDPLPAAKAALTTLAVPTDSGTPIELWSTDGRRVAYIGNDLRAPTSLNVAPDQRELTNEIPGAAVRDTTNALRYTPMYAEGDHVYFWLVMPVNRGAERIGYIAHQRVLSVGPNVQRTMRELIGDSVSLYYRNVDGGFWATPSTGRGQTSTAVLTRLDSASGTARLLNGAPAVYHEERFSTTPLVVGLYIPTRTLFARTQGTVRTLALLSILLFLIGVVAAWLIGRSVAEPLNDLTVAAGKVASGDFDTRVPRGRDREMRRLAESFNNMAAALGASRHALEQQKVEAQAANRAKSEFLTTMSHELRTPLNAIGGYVDLLAMELRGPVTAEQRRDLTRIKTSQEHLLGLVSAVLDLSRIEAGRVSYAITNIGVDAFLRGLDALVAPQAAAKNVTLEHRPAGDDVVVSGDREKLRQVMLNLLSNAIRHTPSGGNVTLSAQARGERIAIIVDDTGPGVPRDRRAAIFEPFVQLDRSLTQTLEGIGLGLAISRDLARGMSGDLVIEDKPGAGEGARFVVLLRPGDAPDTTPESTGEMRAFHVG